MRRKAIAFLALDAMEELRDTEKKEMGELEILLQKSQ